MEQMIKLGKIDNSNRTKCEVWTRAMGYIQRVSNFNIGKKSEFASRKFFLESKASGCDECTMSSCGDCPRMAA